MNEANVVLDTSAILALIRDEPGSDLVEGKLEAASAGDIVVAASFVSLTELLYTTMRLGGARRAEEVIAIVKSWPMRFIFADEALCLLAGEIKSTFTVSFADAFVAATAQQISALLIHKDPEFEALRSSVKLKALPYKTAR